MAKNNIIKELNNVFELFNGELFVYYWVSASEEYKFIDDQDIVREIIHQYNTDGKN